MKNIKLNILNRCIDRGLQGRRIIKQVVTVGALLLSMVNSYAVVQIPHFPTNSEFSTQFEFSTEYALQVEYNSVFLESGAIIAYVDGEIRGGITSPANFEQTGEMVYKLRVHSNTANGESIAFKYYDVLHNKIYEINETFTFSADLVPDFSNPTILTAFCTAPNIPTGLLPEDGKSDTDISFRVLWNASENATKYNVYLWKDGESAPVAPYRSGITGTSTYLSSLEYGSTYHWKIEATNQCIEVESEVQSFTVRKLPDLLPVIFTTITNINSTEPFTINCSIKNDGEGSTGLQNWFDAIYASTDQVFDNNDYQLGRSQNRQALNVGESYEQTFEIAFPKDFEGTYYLFVKSDVYNSVAESNNDNNTVQQLGSINVDAAPLPDIAVQNVTFNRTSVKPGNELEVAWKVANIGNQTAIGGWSERVAVESLSGTKVYLTGSYSTNDSLQVGASTNRSKSYVIPSTINFSGVVNVIVELNTGVPLIEYDVDKANNTAYAASQLQLETALSLNIPPASIAETYPGSIRAYLTRSGNTTMELNVALSTDNADLINCPEVVKIPAGYSSTSFLFSVNDNELLDGDKLVKFTASSIGFDDVVDELVVADNEVPGLSIDIPESEANEGDVITATVTRDLVTDKAQVFYLSSNKYAQLEVVGRDTIPAGQAAVQVELSVVDNDSPELDEEVILTVSANGFYSGKDTVLIVDDDIPMIDFEIVSDTISESSGAYATWGIVRRLEKFDQNIRINFAASQTDALYFPSTVYLNSGVAEKRFNIGVVDNGDVDGMITIDLAASVHIGTCNCSAPAESGGAVTDAVTIIDNDGPSLTATVNPVSLAEGRSEAGWLTVRRNTGTSGNLVVTLSNNDDSEVSIQDTLLIRDGVDSRTIPIATLDDGVEDGDQMVTIIARATDYAQGVCWMYVTDQNKPDLLIEEFSLAKNTIHAEESIELNATIKNNGFIKSPKNLKVNAYLSTNSVLDDNDELLQEFTIESNISAGASYNLIDIIDIPEITGNYYIILKVNPDSDFGELLHINNESAPFELAVLPAYTVTATVDTDIAGSDDTIPVYGSALMWNGAVAANRNIDVFILSNGTRRVLKASTDNDGNYVADFIPNLNESGHYMIGACYPGQSTNDYQDEFDIMGMARNQSGWFIWELMLNEPKAGGIEMKNLSMIDLHNLKISLEGAPEGLLLVADTLQTLSGGSVAQLNYEVVGTEVSTGDGYIQFWANVTSDEGVNHRFKVYYYCRIQQGYIKADPRSINTTMVKGQERYYELDVFNIGAGETGELNVVIPEVSWLDLVTPATIASLSSGDTSTIVLQLIANEETPLNTPISGNIAVNIENGNGISIPYRIEAVSEATGGLVVDVVDEYTYYTEEAPHVKDAHVVVRHPFNGNIVAEGYTNEEGIFSVDSLAEGAYKITVEADKHEGYQNAIMIDPGRVNEQEIYLTFQAITYSWEVVPTEIEDEYEVELVMEFETNVPVPVIVIEMPNEMPQLFNDETYPFLVTVTNKGLITANDVDLTFPDDPEYEFVTNFQAMDILAQQSIQVPVVMRRKDAFKSASVGLDDLSNYGKSVSGTTNLMNATTGSEGNCVDYMYSVYWYECDGKNWQKVYSPVKYTYRVCDSGSPVYAFTPTGGGDPVLGGGGGGTDYNTSTYTPTITTSSKDCDNCMTDFALNVIGCLPWTKSISYALNAFGCAKSFYSAWGSKDADWLAEAAKCGLSFTEFGCISGLLQSAACWANNPNFNGLSAPKSATAMVDDSYNQMPPILLEALTNLYHVWLFHDGSRKQLSEFFGPSIDLENKVNTAEFISEIDSFIAYMVPFDVESIDLIKENMAGTDFSAQEIDLFVQRWNLTLEAEEAGIFTPNDDYPNIIDHSVLDDGEEKMDSALTYVYEQGYNSLDELYTDATETIHSQIDESENSVCASVSISIKQKLTMTREAFEGTLTIFNGHHSTAMSEVQVDLEILNENGELSNDLFEIETKSLNVLTGIDGDGTLQAGETGSAVILFIPERSAAPEIPHSYSFGGSFSYIDPFTGTRVTKPLFPVTLEVHPSPFLYLHYFMQRDILGDDPLTMDVEPIVPAELALMIENNGYGEAKNVRVESAQPEIIDNEKGLAIDFELIGSNLQGESAQLGLTNIDFGNIQPGAARIGQWWFTSTLLGHFINYEATVTHLDSRGNPNLSLVEGATLHELIKSIRVYGDTDDELSDFLVNEKQDKDETPDAIYLSQGNLVLDVSPALGGSFSGNISAPTFSNMLNIEPENDGWNYIKLDDPSNGRFSIVSVVREIDGQEIPLENIWQTHVTMPDGGEPVYENKIHFVDYFENFSNQNYQITWEAVDESELSILEINGVPDNVITEPLQQVEVVFSKPIVDSTFTFEDIDLRVQGGDNISDETLIITKVDDYTYMLDLTELTIDNGYFVLTVQSAGITDADGVNGAVGKMVSWTQFIDVVAIEDIYGLPENLIGRPFDELMIVFNVPIDPTTFTSDDLFFFHDTSFVYSSITIESVDPEMKVFKLSGLAQLMDVDGIYTISTDLTGIQSATGVAGIASQEVSWMIDTSAPIIENVIPLFDGGLDLQHITGTVIQFNEPTLGVDLSIFELWKDGIQIPINEIQFDSLAPMVYQLSKFKFLTYSEGNYELVIKTTGIHDLAGNSLNDTLSFGWYIDRTAPAKVEDLRILPDLGFSDTDFITSSPNFTASLTIPEDSVWLQIVNTTGGNEEIWIDSFIVQKGTIELEAALDVFGSIAVDIILTDMFGNSSQNSFDLYIDNISLQGNWINIPVEEVYEQPDTITLKLSAPLLNGDLMRDFITLKKGNELVDISGLNINVAASDSFVITNIDAVSIEPAEYEISVDMSKLQKYSSGKNGSGMLSQSWKLLRWNNPPVANAGDDINIHRGRYYNLSAANSFDEDEDSISFKWIVPEGIVLDDSTSINPVVTIPVDAKKGTVYSLILQVSDGEKMSTDKINLTVYNAKPVAAAGDDLEVHKGREYTLNGLNSYDPDEDAISFSWIVPENIEINDSTLAEPSIVIPANVAHLTTFTLLLNISDGELMATDTLILSVINQKPEVTVPDSVSLIRNAYHMISPIDVIDADDDSLTYEWNLVDVSYVGFNHDKGAKEPIIIIYNEHKNGDQFALVLTTSDGEFEVQDTIWVTVVNNRPVAVAGNDMEAMRNDTVLVDGSASFDPDEFDNLTYHWYSNDNVVFTNANSAIANVQFNNYPEPGEIMELILEVGDGEFVVTDTMLITIFNNAPIAILTDDFEAPRGGIYMLDGRESYDPNGEEITYFWFAPSGIAISDTISDTITFEVPFDMLIGTELEFVLQVTDGQLYTRDTVVVTVVKGLSVDEYSLQKIVHTYPNPANKQLTIKTGDAHLVDLKVADITGKEMKVSGIISNEQLQIELEDYSEGIYLLLLNFKEGNVVRKFVIDRN